MATLISQNDLKLRTMIKNAPIGLVEVNSMGAITERNLYADELLKTLAVAFHLPDNNLYSILQQIGFSSLEKIQNFSQDEGLIVLNELVVFSLPTPVQDPERHFNFTVSKFGPECIMFSIDDITYRRLEDKKRQEAELGKAIAESKFDIASGVLHDIGNAVVGFGSYLTRIRRSLDQSSLDNLTNLALFVERQKEAMVSALGEEKAGALVTILKGISQTQKDTQQELHKSITEQHHIITHIQEILAIQRQYVSGNDTHERKPVKLRSIINDCMAMVFASIDKRGIEVALDLPPEVPILKGDRTKLMQVFLNLLKNSIEAIDLNASEKLITIHVHTEPQALVVTIRDSGKGFDEATSRQLFNREFTTKQAGSGLGLYNCKTIIESHSGSIQLTSPGPGQGALATIQFLMESE